MRTATLLLMAIGGLSWAAGNAQAQDNGAIRLLGPATVTVDGSPTVDVTPVRVGAGWRGYGYYPGWGRPYGGYYGGYYRPYGGYYYGGYRPGYYGSYYRGAYRPYYWRY